MALAGRFTGCPNTPVEGKGQPVGAPAEAEAAAARIGPTVGECEHTNTRHAIPPDGGDTLRLLCLNCHAWQNGGAWLVWDAEAGAWDEPDDTGAAGMAAPTCPGCGEAVLLETDASGLCCVCRLARGDTLPTCRHKRRERLAPESNFRTFIESWKCLDCGAVKGGGRSRWRRPDLDALAENEARLRRRAADTMAALARATGDGAIG